MCSPTPVSYTHLDVYKRQDVFNEMILEDYYVIRITYENNFEDDFDEY